MEQVDPLSAFFATAKRHRIPMAAICDRAKVDPTTPSRWKRGKNGATVETLTALNGALSSIIAEQSAAA
jgi:transcriptional regulator with XRE-family HTH domain